MKTVKGKNGLVNLYASPNTYAAVIGTIKENTEFKGMHYVECYAIHEGVVIARGRIEVPIDPYSNIRSI